MCVALNSSVVRGRSANLMTFSSRNALAVASAQMPIVSLRNL